MPRKAHCVKIFVIHPPWTTVAPSFPPLVDPISKHTPRSARPDARQRIPRFQDSQLTNRRLRNSPFGAAQVSEPSHASAARVEARRSHKAGRFHFSIVTPARAILP